MPSKKTSFLIFIASFFTLLIGLVGPTYANVPTTCDDPNDPLGLQCAAQAGLTANDPRFVVARIINVALGFLGILATVLIVYAGFLWMTAGGNDEQAGKAKKIIFAAVIGLAIILSAYSISRFALKNIYQATTNTPYGGTF